MNNSECAKRSDLRMSRLLMGLVALTLGSAIVFLSGILYAWIPHLGRLWLVWDIFYAFVLSRVIGAVYGRFERDDRRVFLMVSAALGLLALYASWFWHVWAVCDGVKMWNPIDLLRVICQLADGRVVVMCGQKLTGQDLLLWYCVEAAVIVIGGSIGARASRRLALYCDTCEIWFRGILARDVSLSKDEMNSVLHMIVNGEEAELPDGGDTERYRYRFRIRYCRECGKGALSVRVLIKQGRTIYKEYDMQSLPELALTEGQVSRALKLLQSDTARFHALPLMQRIRERLATIPKD